MLRPLVAPNVTWTRPRSYTLADTNSPQKAKNTTTHSGIACNRGRSIVTPRDNRTQQKTILRCNKGLSPVTRNTRKSLYYKGKRCNREPSPVTDDGVGVTGHVVSLTVGPVSVSAKHYSEKKLERLQYRCSDCDKDYQMGIKYFLCSKSERSYSVSIGPVSIDHNGNVSISASAGAHLLLGGSISIGFNKSEFENRRKERFICLIKELATSLLS